MNELLKELAVKAKVEHCVSHVRLQEFAELIIKECIDNVKVWEKDSRNHISYCLKRHFGIDQ